MSRLRSYSSLCAGLITALGFVTVAEAARSTPNPMTPRVLNATAYHADYSYGYSLLTGNAIDTLETPNRVVGWNVNYEFFDRYVLRPVAHGYALLPRPVQTGVGNFLSNLNEPGNTLNNLLIGEPGDSLKSLTRFCINSTVGILGFIDVAGGMGLDGAPMEMSTVLGRAGMEQGPYIMVPLYGPTTGRELHGDTIDDIPFMFFPFYVNVAQWALNGIHARAQLIDQEGVVDNAFDPYVSTRDIYLMYSEGKVHPEAALAPEEEEFIDPAFLDEIDG